MAKKKPAATTVVASASSKRKNYYKLQFDITERNKERNLRRHIRHFPDDIQATRTYGEHYG